MRLRQLARKLEVNPNRLLEILSENGHTIENDPNFKLTEEQEQLINSKITPRKVDFIEVVEDVQKEVDLEEEAPTPKKKTLPKKIELKEPKAKKVDAPKIYSLEKEIEEKTKDIELIKAPKLKLDGLKVLGKIDLPAPKQKPVKEEKEAEDKVKDAPKARRSNTTTTDRKRQPERKQRPNSLELERRRIEREAKQKREAEEKHLKALKEKHYKETVLAKQKANAAKKRKKATQFESKPSVNESPIIKNPKAQKTQRVVKKKSALGRFWAWLNGAYDNY